MDARRSLIRTRRGLLALFAFGVLGTGVELLLLEHFEDWKQWLPLVLLGLALPLAAWVASGDDGLRLRALMGLCWAFVASGVLGVVLHYRANMEFELEMYSSLSGFDLFRKSITGATPALAPGTMVLLGFLGLLFVHAGLQNADSQRTTAGADNAPSEDSDP
jgi:hypothetical protein